MAPVLISPIPGFVVKSSTTAPGFYSPLSATAPVPVPVARKVFINLTYHSQIPAPADVDDDPYIPTVVSTGREDIDKAGNPALVFDAILNPSLKPRLLKDNPFRSHVLEVILSHIESPPHITNTRSPRSLTLSRTLATPNIRVKGSLQPREIEIPVPIPRNTPTKENTATDLPTEEQRHGGPAKRPLIEELPDNQTQIGLGPGHHENDEDPHARSARDERLEIPISHWERASAPRKEATEKGSGAKLVVELPGFTHADHTRTGLFLSPDMLTLRTPKHFLQINSLEHVEVEHARAEWRVMEGKLVVYL